MIEQDRAQVICTEVFPPKTAEKVKPVLGSRYRDIESLLIHLPAQCPDGVAVRNHGKKNNVSLASLKSHRAATADLVGDYFFLNGVQYLA